MTTRSGPRPQRVFTTIGILTLLASWSSAVAQQPGAAARPHLVLTVVDCVEREDAIRAIVAVEVGELLLERGAPPTAGHDQLLLTCAGGVATIEARSSLASTSARRSLNLAAFPGDAAARALALAGVETLAEVSPAVRLHLQERSRRDRVAPLPLPIHLPVATPIEPDRTKPPALPNVTTLSAAWRGFRTTGGAALWGARLTVDRGLAWRWNAAVDLEVAGQSRAIDTGAISVATVSLGAFGGVRVGGPTVMGVVGVGGRLGMVNFSGRPDDAARFASASVIRPWWGPAATARLMALLGRWVVSGTVEAGMTVRSAEGVANGDIAVAIGGPWLAVSAGFGIRH